MNFNIDNAKSYKTEANLERAIVQTFGNNVARHMVVCNREGRFVALFPQSWNPNLPMGGIAHAGFMVVG